MLCCVALFVGLMLAGITGQLYLLPVAIIPGVFGDVILYRKYKTVFSPPDKKDRINEENTSCCNLDEPSKNMRL